MGWSLDLPGVERDVVKPRMMTRQLNVIKQRADRHVILRHVNRQPVQTANRLYETLAIFGFENWFHFIPFLAGPARPRFHHKTGRALNAAGGWKP